MAMIRIQGWIKLGSAKINVDAGNDARSIGMNPLEHSMPELDLKIFNAIQGWTNFNPSLMA
jgi:hypothetical protein